MDRRATSPAVLSLSTPGPTEPRAVIFKAIAEPRRKDVLIGAIVLEDLDLVVDCRTQRLHPRDPKQILAEIE